MKKYDVVYPERYESNGEEKTRWHRCGAILDFGKGPKLKLDLIPTNCDGWFQLFEPKQRDQIPDPRDNGPSYSDGEPPF